MINITGIIRKVHINQNQGSWEAPFCGKYHFRHRIT